MTHLRCSNEVWPPYKQIEVIIFMDHAIVINLPKSNNPCKDPTHNDTTQALYLVDSLYPRNKMNTIIMVATIYGAIIINQTGSVSIFKFFKVDGRVFIFPQQKLQSLNCYDMNYCICWLYTSVFNFSHFENRLLWFLWWIAKPQRYMVWMWKPMNSPNHRHKQVVADQIPAKFKCPI